MQEVAPETKPSELLSVTSKLGYSVSAPYDYLATRLKHLNDRRYRQCHLPIGSGVTEAACKTVFSQRLKQAGMSWSIEGGQVIVDLRVIHLSGVWKQVHHSYLQFKMLPEMRTQQESARKQTEKAA